MQRRIRKILSTFVEGVFRYLTVDNKIHANFFQNTTSGRPSCSSPNLLQLPSRNEEGKKIKEVFVAPNGYVLHSADFSGLELRFLAWLSNDRVMWPAFQNGIDVHALTCSKIKNFGLTYEQAIKDREKRFVAKTTNFLICYGGSYETLQDTLLKQGDIFINKKLCSEFIDTFFQTYPDIRVLQDKVLEGLCTNGYVKNLYGRERFFPELKGIDRNNKANMKKINMAHRAAFSHFIQSSSSGDYGAYKTVQLDRLLRALNCGRFYLNFYDGYYSLVQEEKIDKFKSLAKQLLEKPEDPVSINLPVEESIGKNWGQLK